MFSRCLEVLAMLALMSASAVAADLRVCADPDNLPMSNDRQEGFENRILQLVARDLDATLVYVWGNERRSTALEQLHKGRCDLVPGAIAGTTGIATTSPYMRSSYALVSRAEEGTFEGFDDPRLRRIRIGVQSVGDDAVTPPVEALLHRGLRANILPYTLHGNASDPNTAGGIVHAVATGEIDAAVLWGPFAGYYAARQAEPLKVTLVSSRATEPPMSYAISMALRPQDVALRDAVDRALAKRRPDIATVLTEAHVPLLPLEVAQ